MPSLYFHFLLLKKFEEISCMFIMASQGCTHLQFYFAIFLSHSFLVWGEEGSYLLSLLINSP